VPVTIPIELELSLSLSPCCSHDCSLLLSISVNHVHNVTRNSNNSSDERYRLANGSIYGLTDSLCQQCSKTRMITPHGHGRSPALIDSPYLETCFFYSIITNSRTLPASVTSWDPKHDAKCDRRDPSDQL